MPWHLPQDGALIPTALLHIDSSTRSIDWLTLATPPINNSFDRKPNPMKGYANISLLVLLKVRRSGVWSRSFRRRPFLNSRLGVSPWWQCPYFLRSIEE